MNQLEARERGYHDARRGRAPIFRSTRRGIEPTCDDPSADEWTAEQREAYLAGYERGER